MLSLRGERGVSQLIIVTSVGKEKFNLTHGSILGITHDFFNVLAFRHQARHPSIKGAYFVGASAHPGTGVSSKPLHKSSPLVLADQGRYLSRSLAPSFVRRPCSLISVSRNPDLTHSNDPSPHHRWTSNIVVMYSTSSKIFLATSFHTWSACFSWRSSDPSVYG